jgi:hypothetical protein
MRMMTRTRKMHPIHHQQPPLSMMMFYLPSFPLLQQLSLTILRLFLHASSAASSAPAVHDEMRR